MPEVARKKGLYVLCHYPTCEGVLAHLSTWEHTDAQIISRSLMVPANPRLRAEVHESILPADQFALKVRVSDDGPWKRAKAGTLIGQIVILHGWAKDDYDVYHFTNHARERAQRGQRPLNAAPPKDSPRNIRGEQVQGQDAPDIPFVAACPRCGRHSLIDASIVDPNLAYIGVAVEMI